MHKRLTTYILPADGDSCGYRKPSFPLEVYEKIDFLISVNSSCSDYGLTHTLNLGHTMEDYLWYETTPTLSNKLFLSYILIERGGVSQLLVCLDGTVYTNSTTVVQSV